MSNVCWMTLQNTPHLTTPKKNINSPGASRPLEEFGLVF